MSWRRVSDARSFLSERGQMRAGPHKMTKKICHWVYCATCGILALNNDACRRALRAPCTWEE